MPHILIVDDEPDTCGAVAAILQRHGYQTTCASNGWEALLVVDRERFDLILLDVMMPGMDGAKFLNILRGYTSRSATPVVVMTALRAEEAMARVGGSRTHGVIEKGSGGFYDKLVGSVRMIVGPGRRDEFGAN